MTVSSTTSSIIYVGDGLTTEFDVPFRFLEDSDLQLSIQATDGTVTNLVLNSDYTVSGANEDNGGKVYLVNPVGDQAKLSILRIMDMLQEVDYRENERFPAESHERALDKLTFEVQQLQEQSDRAIKVGVFSDVEPDVLIGHVERVWNSCDNIDIVANDKANMDTVALNIADVNTAATNIADINTNADNITDINTNASNITDITTTASHISAVETVSDNVADVSNVSNSIGNVNAVANSISNVNTVSSNIADVNTTATNIADVNTVAGISTQVVTVAGIAEDIDELEDIAQEISTVTGIADDVTTVAGISTDVSTVAGIASDVSAVENISADVSTVAAIDSAVSAVAAIDSSVSAVAGDINRVDLVADDISSVHTVAVDISNVIDVAANKTNIDTVAGISSDVTTVAGISANVPTVAANDTNITTVATNISDVNTAATNMTAIQAAPTAASNAAASATLAQDWATKMDGQVASTDYSSKYYANQSSLSAQQAAISAAGTHFKLFQHQWFDYELNNDMAWLRADTFSWQDGTVYTNAYNHLVDDIDGVTSTTETINGSTVTFYRAADGHKIVLADQETTVENIYTSTGVAWYYVLDTVNSRFKLPRTKYDFDGLRGNVGDYISESLPNITGAISPMLSSQANGTAFNLREESPSGALKATTTATQTWAYISVTGQTSSVTSGKGITLDASGSSSTYQNSAPVQQRGTQQYLYFYVGQFSQSAIEQTAGLNAELFNNKIDINGSNILEEGANKILSTSSYTTNRILEIPQDIKLELSSGTLSLKNGSNVYVPNGFETDGTTPKFDVVNISNDLYVTPTNTGSNLVLYWVYNGVASIVNVLTQYCASGTTAPGNGYYFWFDTTNNKIKYSASMNNVWIENNISLPICLGTTAGSSGMTSIDQIFNGFGYIGSTVFILPGVKVQAPNGKNEDGTYKSNILTQSSVGLTTFTANANGALVVRPNSGTPLFSSSWHFDSENGYISTAYNIPTNAGACILCGYLRTESLRIVDFTFGNADSIANSNASNFSQAGRSYLSGLGMPDTANAQFVSNSFATSTNFTAPASGWYCCRATSTTTSGNMMLFIAAINSSGAVVPPYNGGTFPAISTSGTARQVLLPVNVGQRIQVQYSNASISGDAYCGLWFIPAKGEN